MHMALGVVMSAYLMMITTIGWYVSGSSWIQHKIARNNYCLAFMPFEKDLCMEPALYLNEE
jgi:hypothetical protein